MKPATLLFFAIIGFIAPLSAQYNYQSWSKVAADKQGTLNAHYFQNYPYAYPDENGKIIGIEADILRAFSNWLEKYKEVKLDVQFRKFDNFSIFYESVKDGGNGIVGCGSVTNLPQRRNEVQFSAPYLQNAAVLVSALEVNTLISYREFPEVFKDRIALIVKNSAHEKEMKIIKEKYFPEMQITYVSSPKEMLMKMKEDSKYFGYVDLITYWAFINEQGNALRVHRTADLRGEIFGFIFPKNSDWSKIFNEFMVGGLGFTSTAEYHSILDRYLELRVVNEVQVK
jgi:ABC-type amino acid transport substrate-binding protein